MIACRTKRDNNGSVQRVVHKLPHIEIAQATMYYGHMSPGQVVLINGHIAFHGAGPDALRFDSRMRKMFKAFNE